MTTKQVIRYQCDFCGKRGHSAGHMRKHEKRCTKNPNRECGVCKMIEQEQPKLADLLQLLQLLLTVYTESDDGIIGSVMLEKWNDAAKKVWEASGHCPACTMAALRQKGIPLPAVKDVFDFTKEMQAIWTGINEAKACNHDYDY